MRHPWHSTTATTTATTTAALQPRRATPLRRWSRLPHQARTATVSTTQNVDDNGHDNDTDSTARRGQPHRAPPAAAAARLLTTRYTHTPTSTS